MGGTHARAYTLRGRPTFNAAPGIHGTMMTYETIIDVVKILGASAAFLVGLFQYRKAQTWKQAEFIANEVKEFNGLPDVRNAKLMLDWRSRYIDLFPERAQYEERRVLVTCELLVRALASDKGVDKFSQAEARIRDVFDEFLGRLERFENFIASGLITKDHCEPYLTYWIELIGDDGPEASRPDLVHALGKYIREYKYDKVESLLNRFGYNIDVTPDPHPRTRILKAPNNLPNDEE